MSDKISNKKKLAIAGLAVASAAIVTPGGNADAKETPMSSAQIDETKWSTVEYTIDNSSRLKSDKISIKNIYTTPQKWYSYEDIKHESTGLEAIQTWEAFLNKSTTTQKIVGSDLDPSNPIFKDIFGWDDYRLHSETIQSSWLDTYMYITNSYMTSLSSNNFKIFANKNNLTDKVYAQLKAAKLRADISKQKLIQMGRYDIQLQNKYENLEKYFKQITHYYNYSGSNSYMPVIEQDSYTSMSQSDRKKLEDGLRRLPSEIRELFSQINIVGKSNQDAKDISRYLGYATNDRIIHLNGEYSQDYFKTAVHEVGHTLDFLASVYNNDGSIKKRLSDSPEFQEIHKTEYKNMDIYYQNTSVEGFAEGFARWALWKYGGYSESESIGPLGEKARVYFDQLGNELFGDDVAPLSYKKTEEKIIKNNPTQDVATTSTSAETRDETRTENKKEDKVVTRTTTVNIPIKVIYVEDKSLAGGATKVEQQGQVGSNKTIVTVTADGAVTTQIERIKEMKPKIVKVGTKTREIVSKLPYKTIYRQSKSPSLKGKSIGGFEGSVTTKYSFRFVPGSGRVITKIHKLYSSPTDKLIFY